MRNHGERRTLMNDGLMGRTANGDRGYVAVMLTDYTGEAQTVEHDTVTAWQEVSITGTVVEKGRRNASQGGQCIDALRAVVDTSGTGYTVGDARSIAGVWERWHLNGMRSKCAHQDPSPWGDTPWDKCEPCKLTGYKAGSAWLVEQLPHDGTGTVAGDPVAVLRFIAGRTLNPTHYAGN